MKRKAYFNRIVIIFSLFSFLHVQNALAYIDPGTGSYMLQLIIAAFFGIAFTVKIYFRKIKGFLTNLMSRKVRDEKDEK